MLKLLRQSMCWIVCALGLLSSLASAKEAAVYTGLLSRMAVSGYDTVAYFRQHAPIKGSANISINHQGATWYFSSLENRDIFLTNPARYAPQYGGYCAWAVSQGDTASADPLRWKIVNDKLYLNYDGDVQKKWEANYPEFIKQADKNWPQVIQ